MPEKRNLLGPTGETVQRNLQELRKRHGLGYAELSRRLDDIGRPIATLGLQRIEKGARRVDADDLVALAVVLEVSPATLLMPAAPTPDAPVEVTGASTVAADAAWGWLTVSRPLERGEETSLSDDFHFQVRANPRWQLPHRTLTSTMTSRDHRDLADRMDAEPER